MFGPNVGPPMLPNGRYNNNYTIVQTADYVMINAEVIHDTRIIKLGEPDRLPDHIRPWMGDSWGHWEGDVLVVETTNFHPMQEFNGIPAAADLKVTERFNRIDEETILYEFTIDDPATYPSHCFTCAGGGSGSPIRMMRVSWISSDYTGRRSERRPGYASSITVFAPLLREAGIDEDVLGAIQRDNPRRFLAFVPVGS